MSFGEVKITRDCLDQAVALSKKNNITLDEFKVMVDISWKGMSAEVAQKLLKDKGILHPDAE